MDVLANYLDAESLTEILTTNGDILILDDEEIESMISILVEIGLSTKDISEIICTDPFYITRTYSDIASLLDILKSLYGSELKELIQSSPWILEKCPFEMKDFIFEKQKEGFDKDTLQELVLLECA